MRPAGRRRRHTGDEEVACACGLIIKEKLIVFTQKALGNRLFKCYTKSHASVPFFFFFFFTYILIFRISTPYYVFLIKKQLVEALIN